MQRVINPDYCKELGTLTTDDLNLEPKSDDEKKLKAVASLFAEYVRYSSRLQPEILEKHYIHLL